jgi:CBS-domain-containing membrane protein
MVSQLEERAAAPLMLSVTTAVEMMTPNPVSIRDVATIKEALALLTDKGISAAPVIDKAGRPVGVLSRTDLLVHEREQVEHVKPPETYEQEELARKVPAGFQVERVDETVVRDIMTPVVFSVAPDTPARSVINQLLGLNVHRLFVVDEAGVLIGVISSVDVLRLLL